MKIDRIHFYRDQFKRMLLQDDQYPEAYKWECQEIFRREWDLGALDFANVYDRSLSHPNYGNLWGGNHQSAKAVMLQFIHLNREFVRSMFKDLFSQQKDLIMRIERFHFHCDQLLQQLQEQNRRINHHFHEDNYMPTLYLTLRYPLENSVYHAETFKQSLAQIGAKNPSDASLVRFMKVMPILQSQLQQDQELMEALKVKIILKDPALYHSLWLAHDFYHFIAKQ